MKALCYMGPKQLALRDVEIPRLGLKDVLIKCAPWAFAAPTYTAGWA